MDIRPLLASFEDQNLSEQPQAGYGSYYVFSVSRPTKKDKHLKTQIVQFASQITDLKNLIQKEKFESLLSITVVSIAEKFPLVLGDGAIPALADVFRVQGYKLNPFYGFVRKIQRQGDRNKLEVFFQYPFSSCCADISSEETVKNLAFALLIEILLRFIMNNNELQVENFEMNFAHEKTFKTFTCLRTVNEYHDNNSSGGDTFTSSSLKSNSFHSDNSDSKIIVREFLTSYELKSLNQNLNSKNEERVLNTNSNHNVNSILRIKEQELNAMKRLLQAKEQEMKLLLTFKDQEINDLKNIIIKLHQNK